VSTELHYFVLIFTVVCVPTWHLWLCCLQ